MRSRMLAVFLILFSMWGISQIEAQERTPEPQEDFAIRAAREAKRDIGRPHATRYELLSPTRLDNLGCDLAASVARDLGQEVTPYRVVITYPSGDYVMHVTAGGSFTQLCDEKFGMEKVLGPQFSFVPETYGYTIRRPIPTPPPAVPGGSGNPQVPVDPNFVPSPTNTPRPTTVPLPTATLFLGTPLAQDFVCPRGYTGYLVPRIKPGFQTASVASGRVNNRVRAEPNTNGALLVEAEPEDVFDKVITGPACFEGYVWWLVEIDGVQGWTVESDGDNYFLEPQRGVTATPQPSTATPTRDPNIPTVTPTLFLGTPLAESFICPPDLAGFAPIRLTVGAKTARVTDGGSANRLRSAPNSGGTLLGTAEPGVTLDRVLAGPACGDDDVWWLVESNGVRGWTAESRGTTYYLEPLPEFVYTATPTASPTIDPNLPTATPTFTPTMFLGTPLAESFICPPDFAGYLPPLVKEGIQTARVADGDAGNRLRAEPSVEGEQVGLVDPGVTFDRVLTGPACSGTYVWWLVESDGVVGWTVESDASTGDYALDALPGLTPTPSPSPSATSTIGATLTPMATFTPSITPTLFLGTPLPETSICPADFTGYLPPRLTPGIEMARVLEGGSANRLRSEPSTEGELLGLIEPGTTIDKVLTGPACGDDFVWWLVESEGIVGWTVESSAPDYYVEPLEGTPFMTTPTVTVTPTNAG